MAPRSLNPFAPAFVPASQHQSAAIAHASNETVSCLEPLELAKLPSEVLLAVTSLLSDPADLIACGLVSKQLLASVRDATVCISINQLQQSALTDPCSASKLDQLVASLIKYFPSATGLCLAGLPLEAPHIAALLAGLPRLRSLDLSGCKKLTPGAVALLRAQQAAARGGGAIGGGAARAPPGAGGASLRVTQHAGAGVKAALSPAQRLGGGWSLRQLSLQRCFQLNATCLTGVLHMAGPGGGGLQTAALSHLDLAAWPRHGAPGAARPGDAPGDAALAGGPLGARDGLTGGADGAQPTEGVGPGEELEELELAAAAAAAAAAGGPLAALGACGRGSVLAAQAAPACALRVLALHNCSGVSDWGLLALVASCPQLEYLMLGGCQLVGSRVGGAAALPAGLEAAWEGVACSHAVSLLALEQQLRVPCALPAAAGGGGEARGGGGGGTLSPLAATLAERRAAAAAASRVRGLCLAHALLQLPRLRAAELTFADGTTLSWLRHVLALAAGDDATAGAACVRAGGGGACGGSVGDGGRRCPEVWDLCDVRSVHSALAHLRACGGAPAVPGLALALRCAANCSGKGRSTPLHLAAEAGDTGGARALLALGAAVSARDTGGAVPLFLAAEAGRASVAGVLLGAGADALVGNTAGETPLYIAALRGHLCVVRLLLAALQARGVPWQDARLYGDAWTPLHAAAVADRTDVAACLLAAAGPSVAPQLVRAANRYGQTVLHVAARKASAPLLRLLVSAGGRCALGAADAVGDTPLDVARRNSHALAVAEFVRACHAS